jgi:hypothetical protein
MTDMERFILLLSGLIVADFTLTAVAVGSMGATELNPLCAHLGGLPAFLAVKAVVSAAGVVGLFWLGRQMPQAAKVAAGVLCVVYAAVVMWGVGGIVGEML